MDPISLIVGALTAGATFGAKAVGNEAIKDAYHSLKALLKRKFSGEPAAETALHMHETKPEVWDAPLRDQLQRIDAGQDSEIVEAARRLVELAQPAQAAAGKYNLQVSGGNVQGVAQGDQQTVTMHFGGAPKKD